MNSPLTDETMIVTLRVRDLRQIVHEVVAEALKIKAQTDLLDVKQVFERYGIGRDAMLAGAKRGDLELSRGPRRKLLVRAAELERWLTGRTYTPVREPAPESMDEWERQVRRKSPDHDVDDLIDREIAAGRLRVMTPQEREQAASRRAEKKRR